MWAPHQVLEDSWQKFTPIKEIKRQFPVGTEYECFDVTKTENDTCLESLVNKLGGLDILIISAGWGKPSEELDRGIDQKITKTNVNGFVEIANWGFNFFISQGYGQLVTISSIAAYRGSSYSPAYSASKAFQSTYFEGLSIKAKKIKKNVTVTCIEPGFVNTKMAHGGDKMFWIVPVERAAKQIIGAIEKKKRLAY
ncbi:MAG TPA: SDR family NAD(P)-dependent oxidoreductase, partial [Chitinophagaceae bacterium]|nr:SDR family NAD(P)-dependent oxidoreductase [Chitinophagaceae bacterium]